MHLSATLGGHRSPWRFPGSANLERWLDSRPWRAEGGVRVLWLKNGTLSRRFVEALRSVIFGYDGARSELRFHPLTVQSGGELRTAIWNRLKLRQRPTEYEQLIDLAHDLRLQSAVFLISVVSEQPTEIVEAADALVDSVDKVGGTVRPTVVLLLCSKTGVRGVPDDFVTGWPIGCDPTRSDGRESEAWNAYLHERLAWEAGGDLALAEQWNALLQEKALGTAQDDRLEGFLNEAALSAFNQATPLLRSQLESTLSRLIQKDRTDKSPWQSWEQLRQSGLVWLTPGSFTPEPSPWFARALLYRGIQGAIRYYLRGRLICAPLARQILSACFDLEAQERARCYDVLPPETAARQETRDSYDAFLKDDPNSEAALYPRDCPAWPDSVWHFASWGEIIERVRPSTGGGRTHVRHQLRTLRNALSHGHYVSWRMVQRLRVIQQDLALHAGQR